MTLYGSLADDMYMNVNLATEMELPGHRETVLHFFECVRKMWSHGCSIKPHTKAYIYHTTY